MTRAVLGDAIALIRGDRYYTTDFSRECSTYNPFLTWPSNAFCYLQHPISRPGDTKIPNVILTMVVLEAKVRLKFIFMLRLSLTVSGMYAVPKLLMRHLPRHYPFVSHLWIPISRKHFTIELIWNPELRLRLLPLLHSPIHEGEFDQARHCFSVHVYSPCGYPNPEGAQHIHWDQVCVQRP